MAATKMLALFVVLALSWSAATATVFPQVIPTTAAAAAVAAAINHPCTQYCMLQQPFTAAQVFFPNMANSPCRFQQQQQCALHCAVLSQMIQQIASQVPVPYQSSPVATAAALQQVPYLLSNPMLAAATAIQSPNLFNPVVAAVLQSSPCSFQFNPLAAVAAMQQVPYGSMSSELVSTNTEVH